MNTSTLRTLAFEDVKAAVLIHCRFDVCLPEVLARNFPHHDQLLTAEVR